MEKCGCSGNRRSSSSNINDDGSIVVFVSYHIQVYAYSWTECIWILIYGLKAENNACTRFAPKTNEISCSQFSCIPTKKKELKVLYVEMLKHTVRWLFGVREQKPMWWNVHGIWLAPHCPLGAINGWYFGLIATCYPAVSASAGLDVALKRKTFTHKKSACWINNIKNL